MARAVDDSGNIEQPSTGVTVNVNCPCSLWGAGETPGTADSGDGSAVTVGTAFTSDTAGTVTGIRFYKAALNTGTHVGGLYSSNGTLLASATFTGESASGWQQVTFSPAGRDQPEHDVRRRLLRAERSLLRRYGLLVHAVARWRQRARTARRCTRSRPRSRRTMASSRTRARSRSPRPRSKTPTTGWTRCSCRTPASPALRRTSPRPRATPRRPSLGRPRRAAAPRPATRSRLTSAPRHSRARLCPARHPRPA